MAKNQNVGQEGEFIAIAYLTSLGHEILETNWRVEQLEIDIISKKDDLLVFTEVKTRTGREFGQPEQAVTNAKQRALGRAATEYIYEKNYDGEYRFDILSIELPKNEEPQILYIEDAFFPIG